MKRKFEYVITEEIVRFCFEVHLQTHCKDWTIAFTNPTAGPWKKIFIVEGTQKIEIGRYEREEERPDLILINMPMKACVVIEAKDCFEKICTNVQMGKNIKVYLKEKNRIKNSAHLKKWRAEGDVLFINGILWASNANRSDKEMKMLHTRYAEQQQNDPLMAVEVIKEGDDLICYGSVFADSKNIKRAEAILNCLHLKSNS